MLWKFLFHIYYILYHIYNIIHKKTEAEAQKETEEVVGAEI